MVDTLEYISMRTLRLARRLHLTKLVWMATSTQKFTDYFKGFEKSEAVKALFGEQTEQVLRNLKVEFIRFGYMGVNDTNGHLMVNGNYLKSGDKTDIYLDIVHELCHIKQYMEERELFDSRYDYVDRPTEIEAYRHTVQEAKRLGLSNARILDYLKTEWISTEELKRLVKNLNINLEKPA